MFQNTCVYISDLMFLIYFCDIFSWWAEMFCYLCSFSLKCLFLFSWLVPNSQMWPNVNLFLTWVFYTKSIATDSDKCVTVFLSTFLTNTWHLSLLICIVERNLFITDITEMFCLEEKCIFDKIAIYASQTKWYFSY